MDLSCLCLDSILFGLGLGLVLSWFYFVMSRLCLALSRLCLALSCQGIVIVIVIVSSLSCLVWSYLLVFVLSYLDLVLSWSCLVLVLS
jgi:hypothetical protein